MRFIGKHDTQIYNDFLPVGTSCNRKVCLIAYAEKLSWVLWSYFFRLRSKIFRDILPIFPIWPKVYGHLDVSPRNRSRIRVLFCYTVQGRLLTKSWSLALGICSFAHKSMWEVRHWCCVIRPVAQSAPKCSVGLKQVSCASSFTSTCQSCLHEHCLCTEALSCMNRIGPQVLMRNWGRPTCVHTDQT